ncbi:MAG: YitT family protein [Lachnospiraceae bacterium]
MEKFMTTKYAKNLAIILLGNTIYALGVVMFIIPNGLITGGTTGLALLFNRQFDIPISMFVSIFNALMFILGAVILGKKFALTTLVSSFYYPFILSQLERIPNIGNMTSDKMLAVILSGLMIGVGIGIVLRSGASTGGVDIPPLVLNKKFGISVSLVLYILDFSILLAQMVFADKEQVLYGILVVIIYTAVLDKVLVMGKSQMQIKIISEHYEEINQCIIKNLDRGSTLMESETGYLRNNTKMVLTVISNRELSKLNNLVMDIDPKAFMVINQVNEVKGRGFTLNKIHELEV